MGNSTILGYFLMLTPAFCISPGLIGKVYSAKDEPAIRKGTLLNGIVQLFFAFFPMLIGMCAFAAFPDLSNQELALPKAMKEMMPFGISALALSAILQLRSALVTRCFICWQRACQRISTRPLSNRTQRTRSSFP